MSRSHFHRRVPRSDDRDRRSTVPEYGFIAEEVAELFPDLVVYDEAGRPLTGQYHILGPMLVNEVKKLKEQHERKLAELRARLDHLEAALADPPTRR